MRMKSFPLAPNSMPGTVSTCALSKSFFSERAPVCAIGNVRERVERSFRGALHVQVTYSFNPFENHLAPLGASGAEQPASRNAQNKATAKTAFIG